MMGEVGRTLIVLAKRATEDNNKRLEDVRVYGRHFGWYGEEREDRMRWVRAR
jgi:hypothetical protein